MVQTRHLKTSIDSSDSKMDPISKTPLSHPEKETVISTVCCVCSTSVFHYGYEPMNMGCQCQDRICKWCVKVGKLRNCPTCRKYRRKPMPDEKWKRKYLKADHAKQLTEKCLGCEEELLIEDLIDHEKTCTSYRDMLDEVYLQNFEFYRDRVNECEINIKQMSETMDLQVNEIEDLEESVDGLRLMVAVYEAEKRVYQYEQQTVLTTLNKLGKPLQMLSRRLTDLTDTVESLKRQIKESKENHRTFSQKRRRLGLDSESALDELVTYVPQVDEVPATDAAFVEDQDESDTTLIGVLEE